MSGTFAALSDSSRRLRWSDTALAVVGLLLTGLYGTSFFEYGFRWPDVVNVVLHFVVSVSLLIRRAWVRVSFVTTYLSLGGLEVLAWLSPVALGVSPILLCAPLSLWTITRHDRNPRWGVVGLVLGVAGSFASPLNGWSGVMVPVQVLVLLGAYLAAAHLRRTEVAHEADLETHVMLAASQERARIARELHDVIGHSLTVVGVQARTGLAVGTPEQLRRSLEAVSEASREAMVEVRSLLHLLREDEPRRTPTGDLTRLHELIASTRASGVDLHAEVPDGSRLAQWQAVWPSQLRLTVLRIIQESLTNLVKHAGPRSRASIVVRVLEGSVQVSVDNDCIPAVSQPGYGLIGLRERVTLLGGTIEAGPQQDQFRIRVCLPLPTADEERA